MTSSIPPPKQTKGTTPKNSSTPKTYSSKGKRELFTQPPIHDDSTTRTRRFYPYKFSLPNEQWTLGGICASSQKSAKATIKNLYPEAEKISFAKSIPYIFGKKKASSLLKE